MDKDRPNRIVSETELGYNISSHFKLVVEGRFNGYEDANPTTKGVGVAFGLKFISKD